MAQELSQTPLGVFAVAYFLYLAPLLYFYVARILRWGPNEVSVLPFGSSPSRPLGPTLPLCIVFVVWLIILGTAVRIGVGWLGWKMNAKTVAQHKDDLLRSSFLIIAILFLARINNRVTAHWSGPIGIMIFLALVSYYTFFFSLLFEMCRNLNVQLTSELSNNFQSFAIVLVGLVVLLGLLVFHIMDAFDGGFGPQYVGWIMFVLISHLLVHKLPVSFLQHGFRGSDQGDLGNGYSDDMNLHLHLHHWYWAFVAVHFVIFNSAISYIGQAIFIAIAVHGVACFGLESIFEQRPKTKSSLAAGSYSGEDL